MHHSTSEKGAYPKKRRYEDYINYGLEAERTGKPIKGVKGVWPLWILPYAMLIHWTYDQMHTMNNVICDSNKSIRPSNSGNKSKTGHLYKHKNRTYSQTVINGCRKEGIHEHMWDGVKPPWVLTKADCNTIDNLCTQVLGWYASDEVPLNVMRAGHALKSHDTIHWAAVFGRFVLCYFYVTFHWNYIISHCVAIMSNNVIIMSLFSIVGTDGVCLTTEITQIT